jgi:hypothetical protein
MKMIGNLLMRPSLGAQVKNDWDVLLSQPGIVTSLTNDIRWNIMFSPPPMGIPHIVTLRSSIYMPWINTWWSIAMMKGFQRCGQWAFMHYFPYKTIGKHISIFTIFKNAYDTIVGLVSRSGKIPAAKWAPFVMRATTYLSPKTLSQRFVGMVALQTTVTTSPSCKTRANNTKDFSTSWILTCTHVDRSSTGSRTKLSLAFDKHRWNSKKHLSTRLAEAFDLHSAQSPRTEDDSTRSPAPTSVEAGFRAVALGALFYNNSILRTV